MLFYCIVYIIGLIWQAAFCIWVVAQRQEQNLHSCTSMHLYKYNKWFLADLF